MRLYTLIRQKWEAQLKDKYRLRKFKKQKLIAKESGAKTVGGN